MKRMEIILSKEDWSEKYDSDVWLFSRLQSGDIPSSPAYIRKVYSALIEFRNEMEGLKFREMVAITPRPPGDGDDDMNMCMHNCISICSHVLGHSENIIVDGEDENLHLIFDFQEETDPKEEPRNCIYLVMNRAGINPGFPVAAFLKLSEAQHYLIGATSSGWPEGVKGLGICEMQLVSKNPVMYACGDSMLPAARKNKKEFSLLQQGVINLLKDEEPLEGQVEGEKDDD